MFFLKKHWRFTVPAVVVLCVLLLGGIALYSTSEPPEPKTVYVMPERSSTDNSPTVNSGGIATSSLVQSAETTAPAESPTQEFVSDTESLESCCPEEEFIPASTSGDNIVHVSPEVIANAQLHREWMRDFDAYVTRRDMLKDRTLEWTRALDATADTFYATLSPADRASLREGLPEEARQWWPTLFDDVTPARPPDRTVNLTQKELMFGGTQLQEQVKLLNPPPEPVLHDH